ncbi:heme ABC transporter ChuBCD, periplasmic substrate-binding protein [Campylobacter pinnipediorum subsp. caledonicus]|uniref:Heme ABC transporter ChuBCD, periplasmic substrate-binding protein n=1 Tax=Campylobacter pinnipediorum subsp. caledonicus TaxID=1874362 RepID=A0A1S6U6S5_9BACT|nr:ABC transporter substrate-binding protein [Campylobacter pinnipediorum]AQW85771.1 heme ABC transporter ChuBCD, periplasmic substrate-binding protein [Campylobacter pinnipediorum subsp. caledonicus]AQW87382.1 heme ABC transporter ChuBCD, periplasmic substrate-binding protein [Campylobacter pinnipediorum subsp. caledonicus]OPA72540.1 hemin ABC transporter substrate-binding protein [Campylobacter pinnipediorum subsp. caledonicus]
MKKIILSLAIFASLLGAKKLVILEPSVVEMMYMLDSESDIAAISKLTMSKIWPAEKTEKLPSVGTYSKPNIEKIIEIKPDLVVTGFHAESIKDELGKFNIGVLGLKSDSLDDIYNNVLKIGEILDKNEKAKQLVNDIKQSVDKFLNSKFKGKKIAILFSSNPIMAFNNKSLVGDIFSKFGFINIADGLSGQTPIISSEVLLAKNPDFIIVVGGMGSKEAILSSNEALKNVNAVKNDKVITIPSSLLLRGTPRIKENMSEIFEMLK